jgi:hypothetical protein
MNGSTNPNPILGVEVSLPQNCEMVDERQDNNCSQDSDEGNMLKDDDDVDSEVRRERR